MKEAVMGNALTQNPVIRVWPHTRRKLNAVADHQSRKIGATIDKLCDHYLESHGIKVPSAPRTKGRRDVSKAG